MNQDSSFVSGYGMRANAGVDGKYEALARGGEFLEGGVSEPLLVFPSALPFQPLLGMTVPTPSRWGRDCRPSHEFPYIAP